MRQKHHSQPLRSYQELLCLRWHGKKGLQESAVSWLSGHWSQGLPVGVGWVTSSPFELKSLSNCGCCPVPGKPRERRGSASGPTGIGP